MGGVNFCDVLVVGGGLAGCSAAAELAERYPRLAVRVVDAGGGASTEVMGFSAPVHPEDSPERFCDDTIRNANGEGDPRLARILAGRALPELRRLEALGIEFDRTPDGAYDTLRAAGTSCPRVVHSGTTTGREILRRLGIAPERRRVAALLLRDGSVAGARPTLTNRPSQSISRCAPVLTSFSRSPVRRFSCSSAETVLFQQNSTLGAFIKGS